MLPRERGAALYYQVMAVISKQSAPRHESMPGFEGHYSEVDGYLIGFESYDEYNDASELFRGLPR